MSESDIYDMVVNAYYTFFEYNNTDMIFIKTMRLVKTYHQDLTYENILEKIKVVYISENFPQPSLTDSEILEIFNIPQPSIEAVQQFINIINNHINDNNDEDQNDENNDEQTNNNENDNNEQNNDDEHNDDNIYDTDEESYSLSGDALISFFQQAFVNHLNQMTQQAPNAPQSSQQNIQSNITNSPIIMPQVNFVPLSSGLLSPLGLQFSAPNQQVQNFLNKKVNVVMDEKKLKKIRNRQYKFLSDKVKELNKNCTICFDDFEPTSKVKVIPCGHGFHKECITRWLTKESYTCPVCRKPVGSEEDHKTIDS